MKTKRLFMAIAVFFLVLGMVGCAPSAAQIQRAIAQTRIAAPYPTQTPYPTPTLYPTATLYPTPTLYPTATLVLTIKPEHPVFTWAQLIDFILKDHTNWNVWSKTYTCVNFSMDLVDNAKSQDIDAWIVAVDFTGQPEGHAFVAFPTTDRGVIWIEPQSDNAYTVSQIGQPLCLANNPGKCWPYGELTNIIQPAACDRVTHECWQDSK